MPTPVPPGQPGPARTDEGARMTGATEIEQAGTVLLVDDEADIREAVRRILSRAGYTVLVAGGPTEALGLCQHHDGPLDLLLTDALMPELPGRELAGQASALRGDLSVLYM